jgi:hypothetical protein
MEGSNLMKGVDGGGTRWYLNGESVHAGTGLDLLLELEPKYDSDTGDMVDFKPLWLLVEPTG